MKIWRAKISDLKSLRKEPKGETIALTLPKGIIAWFDIVELGFYHVYAIGDPPGLVIYNGWAPGSILENPQFVDFPELPPPNGGGDVENPDVLIISVAGIWHPGQADEEAFSWLNPTALG